MVWLHTDPPIYENGIGTAGFVAPELAAGHGGHHITNVKLAGYWGIGVLIYWILFRIIPLPGIKLRYRMCRSEVVYEI